MTPASTLAFALAFLLLALAPGAGLAMILSRALGSGMGAGFAVTAGLVLGDFLFLGIAMVGLSALATTMGPFFQILKYAGAAYLIYLGYTTFRAAAIPVSLEARPATAIWREVAMGLFVTLGNPKPILFYGALMPTLLDTSKIGLGDFVVLGAIVVAISFLVYGGYMLLLARARRLIGSARAVKRLNQATGVMFVGSGLLVATR